MSILRQEAAVARGLLMSELGFLVFALREAFMFTVTVGMFVLIALGFGAIWDLVEGLF